MLKKIVLTKTGVQSDDVEWIDRNSLAKEFVRGSVEEIATKCIILVQTVEGRDEIVYSLVMLEMHDIWCRVSVTESASGTIQIVDIMLAGGNLTEIVTVRLG